MYPALSETKLVLLEQEYYMLSFIVSDVQYPRLFFVEQHFASPLEKNDIPQTTSSIGQNISQHSHRAFAVIQIPPFGHPFMKYCQHGPFTHIMAGFELLSSSPPFVHVQQITLAPVKLTELEQQPFVFASIAPQNENNSAVPLASEYQAVHLHFYVEISIYAPTQQVQTFDTFQAAYGHTHEEPDLYAYKVEHTQVGTEEIFLIAVIGEGHTQELEIFVDPKGQQQQFAETFTYALLVVQTHILFITYVSPFGQTQADPDTVAYYTVHTHTPNCRDYPDMTLHKQILFITLEFAGHSVHELLEKQQKQFPLQMHVFEVLSATELTGHVKQARTPEMLLVQYELELQTQELLETVELAPQAVQVLFEEVQKLFPEQAQVVYPASGTELAGQIWQTRVFPKIFNVKASELHLQALDTMSELVGQVQVVDTSVAYVGQMQAEPDTYAFALVH
ncbi:Hypothetical_protein [Hexamita inflata]|uniref:Hypothetical_protein n=1 Tax=Hexamita inflata TaxID=28002 RepID=A0AA86RIN5_9EUKA|nr:Hypothetical protein HINF_LOCUS63148 [Hexamita inflata]